MSGVERMQGLGSARVMAFADLVVEEPAWSWRAGELEPAEAAEAFTVLEAPVVFGADEDGLWPGWFQIWSGTAGGPVNVKVLSERRRTVASASFSGGVPVPVLVAAVLALIEVPAP